MKKPNIPPRPEPRTAVLSIKVKKSTAVALEKAAKAASRSKASVMEFALEQWLRENGFLK
jgi:predicted transcriptional regulator